MISRILYYNYIIVILISVLTARIATAQSYDPAEDSYIHDANPNANYGTGASLLLKKGSSTNHRKAYLKFDLTSSGLTMVSNAIVRLYASTSIAAVIDVYEVTDNWSETGITWNNAPAAGPVITTTSIPAVPGYYEWNITAYVQNQLEGDKIVSIVFYPNTVTLPSLSFNSRENGADKPELVITVSGSAPVAPTSLVATAVSPSQVNLSWTDNSDNETGFKVESRIGSNLFSQIATLGPNITGFNHIGLLSSTAYTYRVIAYNGIGVSPYTNEATATTQSPSFTYYYVDYTSGNDNNNGLSESAAWKSLTKVNSTTFGPGDHILFKSNQVWTGRLFPQGSGVAGNPIVIDKYGTGNKPLIDGNGMTGTGVVYLYNQQYWEINNLEITNDALAEGDRRGVRIEAENYGTANHIYLRNLDIHNIKGNVGQGRPEKRTGGIGFAIVSAANQETHFNDILVENCVITNCENQGIITECVDGDGYNPYTPEWNTIKITNAIIRNNTISGISKNAMIIRLFENGVVEHNVCYNTANGISGNTIFSAACSGTVFQYNEGYDNNSPDADGSFYDADLRSPNTYWQYSYSHDNAHGLFWTCTVQEDSNVVCRYNISQNDQGIIFCINYPVTMVRIYNNTVYCPSNLSPIIISERNNGGSGSRTYKFNNNLIYNQSPTASYDFTSSYDRTIDYNCFYGIHPASEPNDPHKVTGNPLLVNPGSGGTGINSVGGYKLQQGSSCINTGTIIANNGGKDYWGNILYNGAADIGAHEYTLAPETPSNLSAIAVPPYQVNLGWTDNSSNETGFIIERKIGAGDFAEIATLPANITAFSNTGLESSVTYIYRIKAFNASGHSPYSGEATAKTNCTWTGSLNSDWATPANWSTNSLPNSAIDVSIPVIGVVHFPVISNPPSSPASAKSLFLENGAILTLTGSLTIAGTSDP